MQHFLAAGRLRRRSPRSQNWSSPPSSVVYRKHAFFGITALALLSISITSYALDILATMLDCMGQSSYYLGQNSVFVSGTKKRISGN